MLMWPNITRSVNRWTATAPISLLRWPALFPTALHAVLSDLSADEVPGGFLLTFSDLSSAELSSPRVTRWGLTRDDAVSHGKKRRVTRR
jgi:hypothetical protein